MVNSLGRSLHTKSHTEVPVYRTVAFALGIITAATIGVLLWFLSDNMLLDSLRNDPFEIIPSMGTLLVAFISLFMSYTALSEQRKARQAGTDPVILVHLGRRQDAPSLVTLEVANVGAGAAMNVSVEMDHDVAKRLFETEISLTNFTETTHPIRVIPQDRSVSYNFGMGHKLVQDPLLKPILIVVKYEDIDGSQYQTDQWLDVRELRWQRSDTPVDAKTASALETIEKHLAKMTKEGRRSFVVVQDKHEFDEAEKAARLALEAQ